MIYGKNYDIWNAHARWRAAKTQTAESADLCLIIVANLQVM